MYYFLEEDMDYSQEGRNTVAVLMSKLGASWDEGVNKMDILYKSDTGGHIYVGGWEVKIRQTKTGYVLIFCFYLQAAENLSLLQDAGVTHIVNCTKDLYNPHRAKMTYFTFDIALWRKHTGDSEKKIPYFLGPMLEFVEFALAKGESVLIHCLVGAHRAGTTGILCLMHFMGMNCKEAIKEAKRRRSLIDPIIDFPELLRRCDQLSRDSQRKFLI